MIVAVLNNLMDLGNPSLVPFWYILFALGSLALLVIGVSRIIVGKRTNRLSIIRIGIAEIFLFAILIFILCGLYFLKWDKNLGNPSIFIWGMAVTIGLVGVLIRYGKNLGSADFPGGWGRCQEYSVASLNMKNLMSPTPRN